uniref:ORF60d n=1 Tax=Pinus koraiensis TaxID=88728 RepID=Q85X42_PINKO|nr:ORF60d [Pinus koraiensis]AAO74021.1 ORF60d [Pinus koraiensis]
MKDPIEAATPMHIVCTFGTITCIISKRPTPGITDPPGQLINEKISLFASSALKYTMRPMS